MGYLTPTDRYNLDNYAGQAKDNYERLVRAYKKGYIDRKTFRAQRRDMIGNLDAQKMYDAYRQNYTSHPDYETAWDDGGQAALDQVYKFYQSAINKGAIDYDTAQKALSGIMAGGGTAPGYGLKRPKLVDRAPAPRRRTTYSSARPSAAAPRPTPTPTPANKPVTAPVVSQAAPQPAPAVPQAAPQPAPAKEEWLADTDNTYGSGWVYRNNADGTKTYRSPSQQKRNKGGITV